MVLVKTADGTRVKSSRKIRVNGRITLLSRITEIICALGERRSIIRAIAYTSKEK
jgi:hypothetical protein